jgi:NADPH-dependent 2,4-dienoyl-CoA reductase/sulfur reductase-like enzyme
MPRHRRNKEPHREGARATHAEAAETPPQRKHPHGRAIVVGASVAGLLAANALSESFEEVLILDRDELPEPGLARRGRTRPSPGHFSA